MTSNKGATPWPLGRDNPDCICGEVPDVNCTVHIIKVNNPALPESNKGAEPTLVCVNCGYMHQCSDKGAELDRIQRNIWARINQEAEKRGIKWKTGDAYCLGSVIKEVLHPEVQTLINNKVKEARIDELNIIWVQHKKHFEEDICKQIEDRLAQLEEK